MTKVLLTDNISPRAAELLLGNDFEVTSLPTPTEHALPALLDSYDAIAVRSATRLTASVLTGLHRLKLIVRGGVGVDNIDIEAASDAGIAVANTPGANAVATAELTFALMLATARNVIPAHESTQRGKWDRTVYRGIELFGKILGVIGFGRIGREVASRARAFGMQVLAYDPYLAAGVFQSSGTRVAELAEIFRTADYITLHVPLTPETRNIIDDSAIGQMKNSVRIINCARGGLIDEAVAAGALQDGRIAGLAIDVYETEPPGLANPLIGVPGVITMPHLGAYTVEAQAKVADEVAAVIRGFFRASNMDSVLNGEKLARQIKA